MADVIYAVEVQLSTSGNLDPLAGLHSKLSGLDSQFGKLGGLLSDFSSSLAGAFTGAVEAAGQLALSLGKIGAVAIGGAAVYGVAKLNNELEKAQIGLAAVFNAQGVTNNFNDGMSVASDMMGKIRKDVAALPGEMSGLLDIFRSITVPGLRAGADPARLEKLAANVMVAGAAAAPDLDVHTIAREAGMLLSGRAGAHNVLGMNLFGLTGKEAQKFNAESAADRLAFLEKGMAKFAPAIDAYAKSFTGLSTTFRDNAKFFLQAATAPLFERIKGALGSANTWFDTNRGQIMGWASNIGSKIGEAFDYAKAKLEEWGPTIWRGFERVREFLTDPATFEGAAHILELYGAVKLGGAIAGPMASLAGAGGFGSAAAGLFGGGAEAAGVGGAMDAIAVAGPAAIMALVGVGSALSVLTDTSSVFHDNAVYHAEHLASNSAKAFDQLGTVSDGLSERLRPVVNLIGTGFLEALSVWSDTMLFATKHLELFTGALEPLMGPMAQLLGVALPGGGGEIRQPKSFQIEHLDSGGYAPRVKRDVATNKVGAGGGGGGTTIKIDKVEITVSSNQEPSRIARQVKGILVDTVRHPTASRDVRNYSAYR